MLLLNGKCCYCARSCIANFMIAVTIINDPTHPQQTANQLIYCCKRLYNIKYYNIFRYLCRTLTSRIVEFWRYRKKFKFKKKRS